MSSSRSSRCTLDSEPPQKMRRAGTSSGLIIDQFQGLHSRSFPGQPPKERNGKAYNMPFSELSIEQKKAAEALFGVCSQSQDGDHWEHIMPRRAYGSNATFVLVFQGKTWNQLTSTEQKAAKLLDMSQRFWDNELTPFHDDLWTIPGVTLTSSEFSAVLKTIRKMSHSSTLTKKELAQFLLSLEKLLLPSQGAAIAEALKASPSWESLLESSSSDTAQYNSRFHVHLVIASFLADAARFVSFSHEQLCFLWYDDCHGCVWGNAAGRADATNKKKKPYGTALTELISRRRVDPMLTRGGSAADNKNQTQLPALPKPVVKYLLDEVLGISVEAIDPFQVSWLYGYDVPLTVFFAPS